MTIGNKVSEMQEINFQPRDLNIIGRLEKYTWKSNANRIIQSVILADPGNVHIWVGKIAGLPRINKKKKVKLNARY